MGNVRGSLFVDYVRMLRSRKQVDWQVHLLPEDLRYLAQRVEPDGWYPMEVFERMGNAILTAITRGDLAPVTTWGRLQANHACLQNPALLAAGDPVETLNRFHVYRQTFFDFPALHLVLVHDDEAQFDISYHMGMRAEEAAAMQTAGFLEGMLGLAGATGVSSRFKEKVWAGDPRTRVELAWTMPAVS